MRLRRGMTRREVLRGAGAGMVLGLGGGGLATRGDAAAPDRTLTVGTLLNIKTLDPGRTLENATNNVDHATYDTLVTFWGEDVKVIRPSLATSWSVSADGRTYTFTLRPNVKFASGNPFTAADVKWSLERQINLKGNGAFLTNGVDAVVALDPMTVAIHLDAPNPALLPILTDPALSPIDSKLVTAQGGDAGPDAVTKDKAEAWLNQHSAGTGPYVLDSYTPNQQLTMVRNPNYWNGSPKLDRIALRQIPVASDQAQMVQKGDLDIAMVLGPDQAKSLRNTPGVIVKSALALNVVDVMMNNNPQIGGPFSNQKVQQAVRYALDYDGILALAAPGSVRAAGILPTNLPGARPTKEVVKADPAHARALLQEANLADISGNYIFSSTLQSFGIDATLLAQKIQQDLSAVGIKLTLQDLPYAVQVQMYRDGKIPFGTGGWIADYSDVSDYLVFLPGGTVGKRVGWLPGQSKDAQDLVQMGQAAATAVDPAKRIALYQNIDRRITEVGPFVPLFQPAVPYAIRSNIRGVAYTTGWYIDWGSVWKG